MTTETTVDDTTTTSATTTAVDKNSVQNNNEIVPEGEDKKLLTVSVNGSGSCGSKPLPVTILSGFLGSGKTTLLKYILQEQHTFKIAVIVNDMAELNIDASLIQHQSTISQVQREVISLQNGCICCTLREDLIQEIANIRQLGEFDYIVIESTGIAEPQQVAQAFVYDPQTSQLAQSEQEMLWNQAFVDCCVTVIDVTTFDYYMSTLQQFQDEFVNDSGLNHSTEEGVKEGQRSIATLFMDQIEFANVILLNKIDLLPEDERKEQIAKVTKVIRTLNPTATIIQTEYCQIDLPKILDTKIFDMKKAKESPGWLLSIKQEVPHQSEMDEYGIGSYIYRARVPFHPNRIAHWIQQIVYFGAEWERLSKEQRQSRGGPHDPKHRYMVQEYGTIYRMKGFIWLAEHDSFMMGIDKTGPLGSIYPIMEWFALIPQEYWGVPVNGKDYQTICSKFENPHGDRRQEIVLIGTHLNIESIRDSLNKCLFTKKELKHYKFYSDRGSLGKK